MRNSTTICLPLLLFAFAACEKTRDLGDNVPADSGASTGVGGTGGHSTANVQLLGAFGPIDEITADATHVYVGFDLAFIVSVSLGTGEQTQLVSNHFPAGIAVDDEYVYFCGESQRISRVPKSGGGIQVVDPMAEQLDETCGSVLLTDDDVYTTVFNGDVVMSVRYTKAEFKTPEQVDVPGAWSRPFRNGDSLYWVSLESGLYEFIRFSWVDDSAVMLLSQPRQVDSQYVNLWGVDENYMYYEYCQAAPEDCTFYRLSGEGGEGESFAADTRTTAVNYAVVTGGYVYAAFDERLVRFRFDGEIEDVWTSGAVIDRLFAYGDHLYIAAAPNLYSLQLD